MPALLSLPRLSQARAITAPGTLASFWDRTGKPTPKSHLSCPSKLKAVHKWGCHQISERWSKLFSLIKPISSNESLLLGLNSSEINPKAAKLPTTSHQCSEAAFLLLQTTLGKYYNLQPCSWSRSPGWHIQSKCFPCSCPVTFIESPKCQNFLLRKQQQIPPDEYSAGQASAHEERVWPWQSFVLFLFFKKETSPETT